MKALRPVLPTAPGIDGAANAAGLEQIRTPPKAGVGVVSMAAAGLISRIGALIFDHAAAESKVLSSGLNSVWENPLRKAAIQENCQPRARRARRLRPPNSQQEQILPLVEIGVSPVPAAVVLQREAPPQGPGTRMGDRRKDENQKITDQWIAL